MRFVMFCAAAAFVSSAAVAGESPDSKKDPTLKIVCRTDAVVGSKIPRRVCKTRAEWDQEAINARAALDDRSMWRETKGKPGG